MIPYAFQKWKQSRHLGVKKSQAHLEESETKRHSTCFAENLGVNAKIVKQRIQLERIDSVSTII